MDPLTATALAGTARASGGLPATGTALDPLIEALDGVHRERALLLAAGAAAVYRHAGTIPLRREAPEPSAPETLPVASPRAANLIASLITGAHADLLPEALGLLRRAGCRLPPQMLPDVLYRTDEAARAAAVPVLGSRGRWLAGRNRVWGWALERQDDAASSPQDDEAIWQEGIPDQRMAVLRRVRDTEPFRARQWIIATWKGEKVDTRHAMLESLEVRLSPDDAALLEIALGDRGEKVRDRASSLLARIPESAFASRMRNCAAALLDYEPAGFLRTHGSLSVEVPETPDIVWRRDARQPAIRGDATAFRETYIEETVALIPPATWEARLGTTPGEILAAMMHADDMEALRNGLSRATLLHSDPRWAAVLWDWWQEFGEQKERNRLLPMYQQMIVGLLALMPPEEAERRVGSVLMFRPTFGQGTFLPSDPWGAVIAALPYPWSGPYSRACLEALTDFLQSTKLDAPMHHQAFWSSSLDTVAKRISPRILGEAATLCAAPPFTAEADLDPPRNWAAQLWVKRLGEFATLIHLRQRIHQTLGSSVATPG